MGIKAFPGETRRERDERNRDPNIYQTGMDLRDYFAAKALPEIIRQWSYGEKRIDFKEMNQGDADNIAEQCYYLADMLVEQSKK